LLTPQHDQEYLASLEKYVFQDDELDEDFALLLKQAAKDKKLLEKVDLLGFGYDSFFPLVNIMRLISCSVWIRRRSVPA
jgi:hypothetical protein